MWKKEINHLQSLHSLFDKELQKWSTSYLKKGGKIYCGKGCANCCTLAVNSSFTEALLISNHLNTVLSEPFLDHIEKLTEISKNSSDLKTFLRLRRSIGGCPFLTAQNCCSIHSLRPFSCRGLYSSRNSDWCAVDFSTLHQLEKKAFMSSLDPEQVAFPTHYLAAPQDRARDLEQEVDWFMGEGCGFIINGNLPYLVYLEKSFNMSNLVEDGYDVVYGFLESRKLLKQYLLHIRKI